jgi:hypothetical protein
VLPEVEATAGWNHDHVRPARLKVGEPPRLDRLVLPGPEFVGIGEIGVLAEQVGDERHARRVEQREARRDRLPAEQPGLEAVTGGGARLGIVEKG